MTMRKSHCKCLIYDLLWQYWKSVKTIYCTIPSLMLIFSPKFWVFIKELHNRCFDSRNSVLIFDHVHKLLFLLLQIYCLKEVLVILSGLSKSFVLLSQLKYMSFVPWDCYLWIHVLIDNLVLLAQCHGTTLTTMWCMSLYS